MTDKTDIIIVERNMNVIIKEKEGTNKKGEPKQCRVSKFTGIFAVQNAVHYLEDKLSINGKGQ